MLGLTALVFGSVMLDPSDAEDENVVGRDVNSGDHTRPDANGSVGAAAHQSADDSPKE